MRAFVICCVVVWALFASTSRGERVSSGQRKNHAKKIEPLFPPDILGLDIAIKNKGIQNAVTSSLPWIVGALENIDIDDIQETSDGFEETLKNIQLSDVSIENASVVMNDENDVEFRIQGLELKISAMWSAKLESWPHIPYFSGDVVLSFGDASFLAGSLKVARVGKERTSIDIVSCDSDLDLKKIHFSKGISDFFLNIFSKKFVKYLRPKLSGAICEALKSMLEEDPEMLRLALCGVQDEMLSCQANVNIGLGNEPISRDSLPVNFPSAPPKMNANGQLDRYDVQVVLSLSSVNYLIMDTLYVLELFDEYISRSVVAHAIGKSGADTLLDTSMFSQVAPGMIEKFGDAEMQIEVNTTTLPLLISTTSSSSNGTSDDVSLGLTAAVDVDFQVRDTDSFLTTAFRYSGEVNIDVRARVENETLVFDFPKSGSSCVNLDLVMSRVGSLDTAKMSSWFSTFCFLLWTDLEKVSSSISLDLSGAIGPFRLANVVLRTAAVPLVDGETMDALVLFSNLDAAEVRERQFTPSAPQQRIGRRVVSSARKETGSSYAMLTPPYGANVSAVRIGKRIDVSKPPFSVVANNRSAYMQNTDALNAAIFSANSGDTIWIPPGGQYYFIGGIVASNKTNMRVQIDGSVRAVPNFDAWPMKSDSQYAHFMEFENCSGLTFTSETKYGVDNFEGVDSATTPETGGVIDGQGKRWWSEYTIGSSIGNRHRPKLIRIGTSENILVENIFMLNSPSFHLQLEDVLHAEVRDVTVYVDRYLSGEESSTVELPASSWDGRLHLQPESLNTDGIDPSGRDVWIHHTVVVNNDDSIAVKPCHGGDGGCTYTDCSEDMLIENSLFTGFGASIGSVPPNVDHNCVRNITFRNISMPNTGKGVYVKSNPTCLEDGSKTGEITNILYEDIVIDRPLWWPIWIGPQQQHEPNWTPAEGHKDCAMTYPFVETCPTQGCVSFTNITLRRIEIIDPVLSPGVVLGNETNPMQGIVFDAVRVTRPGTIPFYGNYQAMHAYGVSVNGSSPDPNFLS